MALADHLLSHILLQGISERRIPICLHTKSGTAVFNIPWGLYYGCTLFEMGNRHLYA